ncbi:hypothetical protein [Oceanimonas baumannii]|uniref:Uncharacterized protein n=1 Tax=Oceanimonas baumannii TaxID=129578 RepID=A0A235CJJ8_9GAMM|nr:hypothetical protein [Oceanimonas baumannii]OYD24723.1 hypothetical protein B6S09_08865 [Oceanimonas baumannii]TDW59471.1 hypothetical protein LY04_01722 [Oceanimonas baumannii]
MIKTMITAAGLALALAAPAFALEIRDTEDCQAAQRAQDGAEEIGLYKLMNESIDKDYDNYMTWKSTRLEPALRTFESQYPIKQGDAIRLPNYVSVVGEFNLRIRQMAYLFHQMERHKEDSKTFEQYRSSAKTHLDAMKATMAKFRKDCII